MAATAVFGTCELLESIIICLPAVDILQAKRVCRTWRTVVKNSKRLRDACIVAPELPIGAHVVPYYTTGKQLKLNPRLDTGRSSGMIARMRMYIVNMTFYDTIRKEFTTSPPCTTMMVGGSVTTPACYVYNRSGITVEDCLHIASQLARQEQKKDGELAWFPFDVEVCVEKTLVMRQRREKPGASQRRKDVR